jgi:hypothetical protein
MAYHGQVEGRISHRSPTYARSLNDNGGILLSPVPVNGVALVRGDFRSSRGDFRYCSLCVDVGNPTNV